MTAGMTTRVRRQRRRAACRLALGAAMGLAAALTPGGCAASSAPSAETVSPGARLERARGFVARARALEHDAERLAEKKPAQASARRREAIALYRRAVAEVPDLAEAWNNLGVLLMQEGQFMEAKDAFGIAADVRPGDPRPLVNTGLLYLEREWAEPALQYFSRALERDANNLDALRGATTASERLGIADEITLERIRRALLIESDPAWVEVFERQRLRVENQIKSRASAGR